MTTEVDVDEGRRRIATGAVLLDVRSPDEWQAGHVEGATWIPMSEIPERHDELPANREIVVICRSGGRSAQVTEALAQWGYDAVNLAGGAQAWVAEGHDLVCDDGSPGTLE